MISKEQIKNLAKLERIELTEEEANRFRLQINKVLAYVKQLERVKFKENFLPKQKAKNIWREDKTLEISKEEREELLNSSSWREGDLIKIPGVFKKN